MLLQVSDPLRVATSTVVGAATASPHLTAVSAVAMLALGMVLIVGTGAIFVELAARRSRRAARAAAAMDEHYREMAEAMPQIVFTARPDGAVDYLNRRWTEYTQEPLDTTSALGASETPGVVHPDDAETARAQWVDAVARVEPYETEVRLRRAADGEYRWHLSRAMPVRDAAGVVVKWFGTCTDIHEQKRAEGHLRAQQVTLESRIEEREAEAERATALYQLLAENATDMVSTHRPNGVYEYATPSWVEYLGASPQGAAPAEFSHPDDYELLVTNHRIGLETTAPITTVWRCRRADGRYGWLETRTRAVRDAATNRVVTFVCATRDVTRSKDDEFALRESEDKYRELVEQAADAILLVEPDGCCAGANTRTGILMGVDSDTLVGQPMESFMIPVSSGPSAPKEAHAGVVTAEYALRRADGTMLPVEASATTLANGRVQIIARDISGRKELERLKDQFVSVVSHELRTPLTSIRGSLGLLASGQLAATPEKAQRMLNLAVSNTDRLIRLINDILDVERINSGIVAMELAWCDGREIANQVIEAMRPMADRVGVTLAVRGPHVRLWADADRITQTLTNLIGNAIKFSPDGSTVEVVIELTSDTARFEVRDRGRGVPPEKLESIFERFQQVDASDARDKGGTGLGLAISRGIVKQHGGRIWAENNRGGGSVFKFTLPLRSPHAPQGPASSLSPHASRERPMRILVIEDDIELAHVIATSLEARGFGVEVAHDGAAAMERHATSEADVLIVDLTLPDTNGLDLIDRMNGRGRPVDPRMIIYTAADPTPAARERIRALGADLATKGRVSTAELVERVVHVIETPVQPLRVA